MIVLQDSNDMGFQSNVEKIVFVIFIIIFIFSLGVTSGLFIARGFDVPPLTEGGFTLYKIALFISSIINILSAIVSGIIGVIVYRRPAEQSSTEYIQNPNTVIQQPENVNLLDTSSDNVLINDNGDDDS